MRPGNFLVLVLLLAAAGCYSPQPERRLTEDDRSMWGRMNAVQPDPQHFSEPWPALVPSPASNTAPEPRFPKGFPARR